MRFSHLLTALAASCSFQTATAQDEYTHETTVFIQPISSSEIPAISLAHIQYNPETSEATISSFEPPQLDNVPDNSLLRIGIYDSSSKSWERASATSALNFAKGYAPVITLSLATDGRVAGVSCRSEIIDAGYTRDFGPKVVVAKMVEGATPELNRPIALSREGKVAQELPEKTFLQK